MKPAQSSLSMFLKKKKKPSFVGLVWLTNSHIILQRMMTYPKLKGYLLKGDFLGFLDCSGFKILFSAIVITSAKDARGEGGGGGRDGECPLFLGHVRLIFATPLPSESLEQGKFTTTDRYSQTSIPELDFTRIPNGQSDQTLHELNTKVKNGF